MAGLTKITDDKPPLADELQSIRGAALKNIDRFCQAFYCVVTDDARTIPFKHNWTQKQITKAIREKERKGEPVRLYILKSRRVGSSTLCLARDAAYTWASDNLETVIIAQRADRAKELLDRAKFFNNSLPAPLRLEKDLDSRIGYRFLQSKSMMTIVAAQSYDVARGGTKQRVLLSEFAHYDGQPGVSCIEVLNEFEQPVAYKPGTEIILETTGKGYGSDAHEFYKACRAGKEIYEVLFPRWQDDPGCTVKFSSECDRDRRLGDAFDFQPKLKDWMKHHHLSPGNVVYAYELLRAKVHKGRVDNWEFFLQEYPCDDEEAWRAHGESYFGSENLNAIHPADYDSEIFVFGAGVPLGQEFDSFDSLEKIERVDENGNRCYFRVWKRPHPNHVYVVSGDSAEGLEDGNFSSSFVIDMFTCEMACEFHGKLRPDEHAYVMASLGNLYNSALLAPEYNRPGNVTLNELANRIYYPNIYRYRIMDDYKMVPSRKLGWETNTKSRGVMLALAKRIVEDVANGRVIAKGLVKSVALLNEMKTFTVDAETGRPEAQNGAQDDRVMAWAIALQVAAQETMGGNYDILSLYGQKTAGGEPTATEGRKIDPTEVIERLME